jgi:mannitol/fructose-specific phosphotransferase system IIA component (Ntr-type)
MIRKRDGLGLGDAKLLAGTGAWVGWQGLPSVVLIAAVLGLVMALGRSLSGVDFESIDGRPVSLVALLLGPAEQTGPHIQALAKISRLVSIEPLRRRLEAATTPAQVLKIISEHEKEEAAG